MTHKELLELVEYRDDGNLYWLKPTAARVNVGDIVGSVSTLGYRETWIQYKRYGVHRLVWFYHKGYIPESFIDHINRDRLDNRIDNLREVSAACNTRNRVASKRNKTGVPGVFWDGANNKYQACICINYHMKFLGRYSDFTEAVAHRLAAEQCVEWIECSTMSPALDYINTYAKVNK